MASAGLCSPLLLPSKALAVRALCCPRSLSFPLHRVSFPPAPLPPTAPIASPASPSLLPASFSAPPLPSSLQRTRTIMGGQGSTASPSTDTSLHDFTVKNIDGSLVELSSYKGKVVLVVNVASQCGLTTSNYKELTELYTKYKDQGFDILAFPSNQFGGQEPGSNEQIKEFACSRFKAEFPIFDKVEVNGPNTTPVYKFLKASKGGGILGESIKWNFTKFLVDKDGKVIDRYAPTTSPSSIEKDIKKALGVN